jgi:hypothetical protein
LHRARRSNRGREAGPGGPFATGNPEAGHRGGALFIIFVLGFHHNRVDQVLFFALIAILLRDRVPSLFLQALASYFVLILVILAVFVVVVLLPIFVVVGFAFAFVTVAASDPIAFTAIRFCAAAFARDRALIRLLRNRHGMADCGSYGSCWERACHA